MEDVSVSTIDEFKQAKRLVRADKREIEREIELISKTNADVRLDKR